MIEKSSQAFSESSGENSHLTDKGIKYRRRMIILSCGLLAICFVSVGFYLSVQRMDEPSYHGIAQCNLKLLSLTKQLGDYVRKHKGTMPLREATDVSGQHSWLVTVSIASDLHCPGDLRSADSISYRFNPALYGKTIDSLKQQPETIVFSEMGRWHDKSPTEVTLSKFIKFYRNN